MIQAIESKRVKARPGLNGVKIFEGHISATDRHEIMVGMKDAGALCRDCGSEYVLSNPAVSVHLGTTKSTIHQAKIIFWDTGKVNR